MTREITHMKAFTAALESMGKGPFVIGKIAPTPVLVDQYFNDSTGVGDAGETDARGPWNEGGDWEIVDSPALEQGVENLQDDGELNKEAAGKARKSGIRKTATGSKVKLRKPA
jgi:Mn-containing catalase